jgi:3-oxoacyl-[acyl-carrier-protein] synthase III
MRFENVVLAGLAHVEAPHRIPSSEIEARLLPVCERLGLRPDMLTTLAGIQARRWWDPGTMPSTAATLAAQKVLDETGIARERIGVLVNTSVCRDYLEPSTASLVHSNLGLPPSCRNYDLGNACLAFVNAMELIGLQLEHGIIDYGLIVDGESSRDIQEATIARMLSPEMTAAQFRAEFASLTLGSGGVAMLLSRRELHPEGPSVVRSVMRAATQHARLCWGHATHMETDTKALLLAGIELAQATWGDAQKQLEWTPDALDLLVLHQVSSVHTMTLCGTLGLDPTKALLTFPEYGNIGPAAVPFTLSKAVEAKRTKKGDRVALMGIGSGLNCAMAELRW